MLRPALLAALLPAAGLLALAAPAAPARAGVAITPETQDCVRSINPEAPVEWSKTDMSLPQLVGSGDFEIRGVYRVHLCEVELTVYVLQNAEDRGEVFECMSDDTYRAPAPCFRLGAEEPAAP